jgi:hypothetical protein
VDVPLVLTKFEELAETLTAAADPDLTRKLLDVIEAFPFLLLTRAQKWRLLQIKSKCENRLAVAATAK